MAARTPERFVEELAQAIDKAAADSDGRLDLVRRKRSSVARACSWTRVTHARLAVLAGLLDNADIGYLPDLNDPKATAETWIRFSRRDLSNRPLGMIFSSEEGLEKFVKKYFTTVFAGHPTLAALRSPKTQEPISVKGRVLKMDMLFDDPASGGYAVVEFKRGDPDRGTVTQVREYMNVLSQKSSKPVRGIIVSARPRFEHVEEQVLAEIGARNTEQPVDWFWYAAKVELVKPST